MNVIYSVNKDSGTIIKINSIEQEENPNQILLIDGIDSEFIPIAGIKNDEGEWRWNGYFAVTKYSNSKGESQLNIEIGHFVISSITRKLPFFEYEFEYINKTTGEANKSTFKNYVDGLKSFSNLN